MPAKKRPTLIKYGFVTDSFEARKLIEHSVWAATPEEAGRIITDTYGYAGRPRTIVELGDEATGEYDKVSTVDHYSVDPHPLGRADVYLGLSDALLGHPVLSEVSPGVAPKSEPVEPSPLGTGMTADERYAERARLNAQIEGYRALGILHRVPEDAVAEAEALLAELDAVEAAADPEPAPAAEPRNS